MANKPLGNSILDRLGSTVAKARLDSSISEIEAVVGLLLVENATGEVEVLLVQRIERAGDPWSGHIGLPGGGIKSTDPSVLEACKREVSEEVGVDLNAEGEFTGSLSANYPSNRPELKVRPLVFKMPRTPKVMVGPEIVSAFWVSLSKLPSLRKKSEVMTRLGVRLVDSFVVDGKIVWGFTFRVLEELLGLYAESLKGLSKA